MQRQKRLHKCKYGGSRLLQVVILGLLCGMFLCACDLQNPPVVSVETVAPISPEKTNGTPAAGTATPIITEKQEIHFTDINFENTVRDVLGKKMGSIYVSEVQQLTSFSARVCGITNISEIMYFTNLEYLDLKGNRISDFSPISNLQKLKYLDISNNFTVLSGDREKGLNLAPLQNLVLLETLYASGNLITDITPLSGMVCLRELDLQDNRLTDITPLQTCSGLEVLNISSNYSINAATGNEQGISSIGCVAFMPELRTLLVNDNVLLTLEGIETLTKLVYLDVTQNYLMTLSPLATCTALQTVIAQNNNLLDLVGLEGHPSIEVLDVRTNRLHYVPEILTMPALQTFEYLGNQILDYAPIDQFEKEGIEDEGV